MAFEEKKQKAQRKVFQKYKLYFKPKFIKSFHKQLVKCDLKGLAWLSLSLLIGLHHMSLPLCTMPGIMTCPCSEFCFPPGIKSFNPLFFKLWGNEWM